MPNFTELITKYLQSRKIKGLSPGTLTIDERAFKNFNTWLLTNNLNYQQLNSNHFKEYHHFLKKTTLTTATIAKTLLIVKKFYHYCQTENLLLKNPTLQLEIPKYSRTTTKKIPYPQEIALILNSPNLTKLTGLRDRAALELTYSAGLRIGEIAALKKEDLDFNNQTARIIGKGQKERIVPFGKTATYYLRLYLKKSKHLTPQSTFFFKTQTGAPMKEATLRKSFYAYTQKLGFKLSFHSLRHACALHLLQNQAPINLIQELLGHSRLETTQIYTKLNPQDLKQMHQNTHPYEKELLNLE